MSRFTEKPMARATEHLASARYAEAAGAFRAVLRIDPTEFQAHFGLADALVARGQRAEAVEGLVGAAEACSGQDDHAAALTLYGKALSIEPGRLELHLDVAMAEAALGRMEAAQSRLENLAEVYMQAGRTDEAAEVYRCLAGWEEGDEEEEQDQEPEPQPAHAAPARVTHVPTGAPSRDGVPMMMTSSETVVISTILVTPDGQLMQMPIDRHHGAPTPMKTGDTVPPIPVELLEAAHSAPIDLAEGEAMDDVERTVVAFPPPPPTLPEHYESAAHPVDRAALEAAVVAAMDNLAQLEEEDMTLIMQRLPPQPKVMAPRTRSGETRLPEFIVKSKPPVAQREREQERERAAAESKLRLRPAPRPATPAPAAPAARVGVSKSVSKGVAPSPVRASAGTKPAAAPARAGAKPAAAPARAGAKPAAAPARASARPAAAPARASAKPALAPARASAKPAAAPARASIQPAPGPRPGVKPAAAPARAGGRAIAPSSGGKPAPSRPLAAEPASPPKATRPNNPLADRLRRRAGLPRPDAAPGATDPRATEPITVRRGDPPNKK